MKTFPVNFLIEPFFRIYIETKEIWVSVRRSQKFKFTQKKGYGFWIFEQGHSII